MVVYHWEGVGGGFGVVVYHWEGVRGGFGVVVYHWEGVGGGWCGCIPLGGGGVGLVWLYTTGRGWGRVWCSCIPLGGGGGGFGVVIYHWEGVGEGLVWLYTTGRGWGRVWCGCIPCSVLLNLILEPNRITEGYRAIRRFIRHKTPQVWMWPPRTLKGSGLYHCTLTFQLLFYNIFTTFDTSSYGTVYVGGYVHEAPMCRVVV